MDKIDENSFLKELSSLINRFSLENGSDTPDYILAEYLKNCIYSFEHAIKQRKIHYGSTCSNDISILPIQFPCSSIIKCDEVLIDSSINNIAKTQLDYMKNNPPSIMNILPDLPSE